MKVEFGLPGGLACYRIPIPIEERSRVRQIFCEILLRGLQSHFRGLRLRLAELLVVRRVEDDAVLYDLHEEDTAMGDRGVHFLKRMDDEVRRRLVPLREEDRKRVVWGKCVSVRLGPGGRGTL